MLWLLAVAVPLLVWFLWWAWRKKQTLVAQFVQSRLLAQLTVGVSQARLKIRLVLIVFAVGCALLALARPQWGFDWEEAKQRGLDIVVAIDTSRSMLAEDVRPNRLARAKLAALDLMKLAKSDRLALVPFAGAAFLQCPLTLDDDAFRQSVEALVVGIIPVGGTALTEAIETAQTAFKEGENYKVLVLFTDGEDHDSNALETAKKAAKAGLKIFTVGVGTPNGELLRVTDESGATGYIKDEQGNVVKSRLDEELLQEIATVTGGFYQALRGANSMETLYEQGLAPLPKSDISSRLVKRYHERFQWPLALACAALLLEMLLPERKRLPRRESLVSAGKAEWGKAVAALSLLLAVPLAASASSASAKRLYEDGKFKESQQEYERLLEKDEKLPDLKEAAKQYEDGKRGEAEQEVTRALQNAKPGDARLHFNAGAAAYKAGDLGKAALHFMLSARDRELKLQERAFYNLGNALYRAGERGPDANEKISRWEKAVESYQGAVQLDPQDADAKYNREFVKKKLEELKKQQPKQDKQNKQNPDKQDRQQQDQQKDQKQKSDSSKPQQQQPKPSKPDSKQQEQKDQQQEANQQQNAANQKQKEREQAKQNKENKPEGAGKGDEKSGEQSEGNAAPTPGQMTVQQAEQLLDTQKGEERAMIFVPQQKLKDQRRVFKDW